MLFPTVPQCLFCQKDTEVCLITRFLLFLVMFSLNSMLKKVKDSALFPSLSKSALAKSFYIQHLYLHIINWVVLLGDNEHDGNININACGRI